MTTSSGIHAESPDVSPGRSSLRGSSPPPFLLHSGEDEAHFWDYWTVLVRHRWLAIAFFLACVLATAIWSYTSHPIFTASATLRIEKEEPRVLKFEEVVKVDAQPDYYQTQLKLLQSRTLANRVIERLGLDQHPEFRRPDAESGWVAKARAWTPARLARNPMSSSTEPSEADDLVLESPLTQAFEGRVRVEPVRTARLVKVGFDSYHADLAARVANALAEAFIAQDLDQKLEATRMATRFLARQMEDARVKLEVAELELDRFANANDILFLGMADKDGNREDVVTQQLAALSRALVNARTERIAKESAVRQALSQGVDSLPAVLSSPIITKLKSELITKEAEVSKLSQAFKPEYPQLQRAERAVTDIRRQLALETTHVVEALDAEYRAALRTERDIDRTMAEHQGVARRLGGKMVDYRLLRRDVDTSRELYTALLTRLKETQISAALVTSNISIVDRAEVPRAPSGPKQTRNLLLGAMIGLFGSVGLAFLSDYLDTSIKDTRAVETVLGVPAIGVIPSKASIERRWFWRHRRDGADAPFAVAAHTDAASPLAESFRALRTNLLYASPGDPLRTLLVTSPQPRDGKTSVATNLAITLAQLGSDVVLIEGDMRQPYLHKLLGVPAAPGLSALLAGQSDVEGVVKATRISNLYLIPAGHPPLNPSDLMASPALGQIIDSLGARFAYIVFDAPSLFGVSDARVLAPRVDGVLLVLRDGRASREVCRRALHLLASVRATLVGVALNDVSARRRGSV